MCDFAGSMTECYLICGSSNGAFAHNIWLLRERRINQAGFRGAGWGMSRIATSGREIGCRYLTYFISAGWVSFLIKLKMLKVIQ